jgi:hypothetical protein
VIASPPLASLENPSRHILFVGDIDPAHRLANDGLTYIRRRDGMHARMFHWKTPNRITCSQQQVMVQGASEASEALVAGMSFEFGLARLWRSWCYLGAEEGRFFSFPGEVSARPGRGMNPWA